MPSAEHAATPAPHHLSNDAAEATRAVRFLSLGQWTLAHSLGGPGPLNTKNKNRAPKARFCGQNSPKRAGFHAFWSPKQQCNHPITPSTDPTDPACRPPDRPTAAHRPIGPPLGPLSHPTLALGLRALGAPGPPPGPCFLFFVFPACLQVLTPWAAHLPRD